MPLLHLNDRNYVLDIGCGVGRLAEAIIPKCHFYLGVDYAEDLLDIARKRIPVMEHAVFVSGAFQELKCITSPHFEQPFDCVIVAGVCQYINDDELKQGIHDLLSLLSEQCVLYISNPVAIEKRLTLKEFYSEELETNYSTIYRTVEEYQNLYQELLDCGFILEEENYFDQFQKFKETRRHYFVFRRRGKPADESRKEEI